MVMSSALVVISNERSRSSSLRGFCITQGRSADQEKGREGEREFFSTGPNPLNRRNDFSRPALRHGNLDSLFQIATYLPSTESARGRICSPQGLGTQPREG